MAMQAWLKGESPKPGSKRKSDDDADQSPAKRKFTKELHQDSFDWYLKDESGKWHCSICRAAKSSNAYAI
jgi:hypothetical protein